MSRKDVRVHEGKLPDGTASVSAPRLSSHVGPLAAGGRMLTPEAKVLRKVACTRPNDRAGSVVDADDSDELCKSRVTDVGHIAHSSESLLHPANWNRGSHL